MQLARAEDVVVVEDVHVLLGLGCAVRAVLQLVQELARACCVLVCVRAPARHLAAALQTLLPAASALRTLQAGASAEVDGHLDTYHHPHAHSRCLYKAAEKTFKLFPMGAAPGTV